jgi:hypothetical protein
MGDDALLGRPEVASCSRKRIKLDLDSPSRTIDPETQEAAGNEAEGGNSAMVFEEGDTGDASTETTTGITLTFDDRPSKKSTRTSPKHEKVRKRKEQQPKHIGRRRVSRNDEVCADRTPDSNTIGEQSSKAPRLPKRQCALLIGFCGTGCNGMQMCVQLVLNHLIAIPMALTARKMFEQSKVCSSKQWSRRAPFRRTMRMIRSRCCTCLKYLPQTDFVILQRSTLLEQLERMREFMLPGMLSRSK